jgi:hypothetical protein
VAETTWTYTIGTETDGDEVARIIATLRDRFPEDEIKVRPGASGSWFDRIDPFHRGFLVACGSVALVTALIATAERFFGGGA